MATCKGQGRPVVAALSQSRVCLLATDKRPVEGEEMKSPTRRNRRSDPHARHAQCGYTHEELIRQLSADDRHALEALGHEPFPRSPQSQQAVRLLKLGLAELSCGRMVLTTTGLTALAVVRSP